MRRRPLQRAMGTRDRVVFVDGRTDTIYTIVRFDFPNLTPEQTRAFVTDDAGGGPYGPFRLQDLKFAPDQRR